MMKTTVLKLALIPVVITAMFLTSMYASKVYAASLISSEYLYPDSQWASRTCSNGYWSVIDNEQSEWTINSGWWWANAQATSNNFGVSGLADYFYIYVPDSAPQWANPNAKIHWTWSYPFDEYEESYDLNWNDWSTMYVPSHESCRPSGYYITVNFDVGWFTSLTDGFGLILVQQWDS